MNLSPRDIIKSKGLKATPQRLAIYEGMMHIGHASADMLISWVNERNMNLTVATVYNVLDSFEKVGIIKRLSSDGIKMFYDINTSDHPHIFCESTNTIQDFEDKEKGKELISMLNRYIDRNKSDDFDVDGIDVVIRGNYRQQQH